MKRLNLLFAFIVLGCLSSTAQNWLTTGNTTTGTEFLGTNSGSSNPNLTFKRAGEFAGQLTPDCVSLGVLSWNNTTSSLKGNTYIGYEAGRFTSTVNTIVDGINQNTINAGNTYIGFKAGKGISSTLISTASSNVCVGSGAGENIISKGLNVYIGASAGKNISESGNNVCIGFRAGEGVLNQQNVFGGNVIIGSQAGATNVGYANTFIGKDAGLLTNSVVSTGINNTYVGSGCGKNIVGSNNTFIGKHKLTSNPMSNTIIISDGNESQRLYISSNGNMGIDLGGDFTVPENRLELNSTGAVANTLGLRFRNFTNTNFNTLTTDATPKVLSVNANGDIILVDDKQAINPAGTLSTTCNTANFITKSVGATGNLTCSSIYDNGTNNIGFLYGSAVPTNVNVSVNGTFGATGVFNTSDKKFKKDIQPIASALDKIMNLEGKTYNWRKDEFKDKNFTSELQYGLLAQDVQKVIPSLVIESENGDLAMNYTGLIPVLIEALKDQQAQINELKQQLTDNFKAQNQDLLQFSNTKIISVSPNPSNDVISISMNIEKEVQTATLQVHDINGIVLSSLNIKERTTNVSKTLQKDNFGKGIYIVSLIVNGKSIDTKKIIFN
jgi:trimeric autotransporter adhesin